MTNVLIRDLTEETHRGLQRLEDLAQLPIRRFPTLPLMRRAYQLRADATAHDAAYVALAEVLDVPLFTGGDRRLANAAETACAIHPVVTEPRPPRQ